MTGDPVRVFIVAPTPFARAGLRSLLEGEETDFGANARADVLVVGEASSLDEAGSLLSGVDVVVVGDEALEEATRTVAEEGTQAILALSEDERSLSVLRGLAPHGWGVVSLDTTPEEFSAAVVAVARGLVVLPWAMTGRLVQGTSALGGSLEQPSEPLTAREREVLDLLGRGLSNKKIARDLKISEHTVKFHVSSIYAKLGAENRAEAVSLGARLGLISL
ncbi:MAG TPA: response regulator transcription factor [Rubrobacteraceae bacterium]|jgi:DNA-binding NarL/FixJ family response regulator|nr:response regulator transcription factor [Rubrobacteraceae bacterium]